MWYATRENGYVRDGNRSECHDIATCAEMSSYLITYNSLIYLIYIEPIFELTGSFFAENKPALLTNALQIVEMS